MLRLGRVVVVAAVAVAFAGSAPAQEAGLRPAGENADSAIRAVQAGMRRAAERLDAAALYAYVLDSVVPPIIENGRLAGTRAAALARTAQGFAGLTGLSYTYTRADITLLSPTSALWVGEGTATATLPDGRQVGGPFAETVVFVRRDGEWKVLHAHRSTPNR